MGQHGVELSTLPNCVVTINHQLFYFTVEDNITDQRGGWSGEAIIVQPQVGDGDVIVAEMFVDNM